MVTLGRVPGRRAVCSCHLEPAGYQARRLRYVGPLTAAHPALQ
jgi:hypothetical protein